MLSGRRLSDARPAIAKAPTGIAGLDEVTRGGLPAGRPTLVCGGPGCGKTVLAMEFLVRGASEFGEPGLFVSFEETAGQLIANGRPFGWDLDGLVARGTLKIAHVELKRDEIIETGPFSLDALLIRLEHGLREIGAKRLALDTMESIFGAFGRSDGLRGELARLFQWVREKGVTTVITGERGQTEFTRQGFEEYVSDCVLLLDHRVTEQIAKRRLRVVKYRGSVHAVDEVPFTIGASGLSVLPIASVDLDSAADLGRVSSGVPDLDALLAGRGYFRGSYVLVSGKAGTGKSSLAAAFAAASCGRGERCLYFSFEESAAQLTRNMRSVGIDFAPHVEKGLLALKSFRPTASGLEEHIVSLAATIDAFDPTCVVIDPITNFISIGAQDEVRSMLTRLFHLVKRRGTTLLVTALTAGTGRADETETQMSSAVDTWIAIELVPVGHGRRREIYVVKSRGMEHSQETLELVMSRAGLSLRHLDAEGHA